MKKIIIAAAAAFLTTCNAQVKTIKAIPESHKSAEKAHIHTIEMYSKMHICIEMTISSIEKTYFLNDDNNISWYYTIYAIDNDNNLYCIADDLEITNISGYEFMLILGNKVMLIYEKGMPDYTGYILPIND